MTFMMGKEQEKAYNKLKDKMETETLSDKIVLRENMSQMFPKQRMLNVEDVREFIKSIQSKVLTDWKGQNEFIDWLKTKSGEELSK